MDLFKNNIAKTKTGDLNNVIHLKGQTKFKKHAKCNKVPLMGKSVLLARQADVTIMQQVNDSDVISKLVLEKFKNVLDYYRQRSWRRHSKHRYKRCGNQSKEVEVVDCASENIPEEFEKSLNSDTVHEMVPVFLEHLQDDKIEYDPQKFEYDPQKFLNDALGDELNNYATSNSETDTYKSNSGKKRNFDDYSVGTSDISTLLSKSNSFYSHFSKKLLRCPTYASSLMYDKDGYEQYQQCEEDCRAANWINEAAIQHQIIVQTSKALNLCFSCDAFKHSVEYVEAEKILLLAIEKREAVLKELKFMEYEDLREDCFCLGFIDIANITVPIINQSTVNSYTIWIFAVVSCGPQVFATEVVQIDHKTYVSFKKTFKFDHLSSDFQIKIRLYALKMDNANNSSFNTTTNSETETTVCPMYKLLGFYRNSGSKRVQQFHNYERRQPSFILHGTVIIHITEIKNSSFLLSQVPNYSPLEGNINVQISNSIEFSENYSGFLTVGSEAGGLATWNRRWCLLSGYLLKCWNYPQDQQFGECICSIDLRYCVIAYISRVDRELCARPRTLLIETGRLSECKDENSLMVFRKSSYTIRRHYLSADRVEEMEEWEKRLNSVLFALRNWNCMKCPLNFSE